MKREQSRGANDRDRSGGTAAIARVLQTAYVPRPASSFSPDIVRLLAALGNDDQADR